MPSGRAGLVVMIIRDVVRQLVECLNERVIVYTVPRNDVTKEEFYRDISLFFWSQLTVM